MRESTKGILAMAVCSVVWGLSSMFYKLLANVPPLEVLSHRTLWSLFFFLGVLAVQGRLRALPHVFGGWRNFSLVAVASVMISTNWFIFILSIQIGQATESSLGYYIFPLVAVLMGAVLLGERLRPLQWVAVAMVVVAVGTLAWGLGGTPWISLALATTFGIYGLIKRRVTAGPVVSVTGEVLLLAPFAALWLWGVHTQGWTGLVGRNLGIFGHDWGESLLLMLSGPLTALPLMLFSYAAKRIPYATQGLVQYINPSLQFLVATMVFGEPLTRWHALAFPIIWGALALYTYEAFSRARRAEARAARVSAS